MMQKTNFKILFLLSYSLSTISHIIHSTPRAQNYIQKFNAKKKLKITIHELCKEYFGKNPVGTEDNAYKLLKNIEKKTTDKFFYQKQATYLAVPWCYLIDHHLLETIPTIFIPNSFSICQSIHFEKIIPLLVNMGVTTLFCPHATSKKYDNITVLPFPHFSVYGPNKTQVNKDIWYSFIGAATHQVREYIFSQPHPENTYVVRRSFWHFERDIFRPNCTTAQQQHDEQIEYQEILARSRFSLCPRGTGPSTIRFWESLEAGAIPVVLSDDFLLPEGFDWSTCIIRIPENQVYGIQEAIANISPEQETLMRTACLEAYSKFSGTNLISPLLNYFMKN